MKKYINGQDLEMSEEELAEVKAQELPYEQRVANRIREKYSVDDELALLRQRVLKTAEFEEYFLFAERIKEEERNV